MVLRASAGWKGSGAGGGGGASRCALSLAVAVMLSQQGEVRVALLRPPEDQGFLTDFEVWRGEIIYHIRQRCLGRHRDGEPHPSRPR